MTTDRRLYSMELGRRDHTRWLGSNRYAGGAPLTLPTANLLAAYDARVGVTNVSGACSAWADQSGNGYHALQATAGKRPTITTTGGFASLQFDGSADSMSIAGITAAAGAKTVYAVVNSTFPGFNSLFNSGTPMLFVGSYSSKYAGYDGSVRDTGMAVASGRQRIAYQISASTLSVWKNGVAATPVTFLTSTIGGTAAIGSFHTGAAGNNFSGHILFLAIYTTTRNTDVEAYITQEWGV